LDLSTIILIILGLVGLFLLISAVFIYVRESSTHEFSSTSSVSLRKLDSRELDSTDKQQTLKSGGLREKDDLPDTRKLNTKDLPIGKRDTDSDTAVPIDLKLTAQNHERNGELDKAADIYQYIGRIDDELRVRAQLSPTMRLADLYLVTDNLAKHTSVLRLLLQNHPQNALLRLRVIKSTLLEGKVDEAKDILATALEEHTDLNIEADFFSAASKYFQATLSFKEALKASYLASEMLQNNQKYACQVQYLDELLRLFEVSRDSQSNVKKSEMLKHATFDSSSELDLEGVEDDEYSSSADTKRNFMEHRVLVGHFAQGYYRNVGNTESSMMQMTPVDRMEFENVLSRREYSALFQTRDKLIDCPTVLRIHRLFIKEQQYGLLRERFSTISKFSHPNISNILYIDRVGPVVRMITEYHQGGSLSSMISQLKNVGVPFIARMLLQIANGIQYAHQRGIIHGDLRPENILVGHDQLMKISDFAIQPWPVHSSANGNGIPKEECMIDLEKFGELCSFLLEHSIVDEAMQDEKMAEARKVIEEIPNNLQAGKIDTMAGIQSELLKSMSLLSQN